MPKNAEKEIKQEKKQEGVNKTNNNQKQKVEHNSNKQINKSSTNKNNTNKKNNNKNSREKIVKNCTKFVRTGYISDFSGV